MKKTALSLSLLFMCVSLLDARDPRVAGGIQTGATFTENKGQVGDQHFRPRPDVLYYGATPRMTYHLKKNGISYQLFRYDRIAKDPNTQVQQKQGPVKTTIYRLDINWLNANNDAQIVASRPLEGYTNYYCEVAPLGVTDVLTYRDLTYKNIFNGIDLHYYGSESGLKYDFIVAAGADYRAIRLAIEGAESITLNADGSVSIRTPLGTFDEGAPVVYQGSRRLKAAWVKQGNTLGYVIEKYDATREMIIDPLVRAWGTWYGGYGQEYVYHCSADNSGNSYITGDTETTGGSVIATNGAHQYVGGYQWGDGFIAKFDVNGVRKWGTYYGTGGSDGAYACVPNDQGEVYMSGYTDATSSSVIATPGAHQYTLGGGSYYWTDAFLVKFNTQGKRVWGTYYGGSSDEHGYAVTLDPQGNVYLAGSAKSPTGIATPGSHQPVYGGGNSNGGDGFIAKFNSAGVRQWGTYYGGGSEDHIRNCHADATGNLYVTGATASYNTTNIASPAAHQTIFGAGSTDAFIAKFNGSGVRQWGTYYGGSGYDGGNACSGDGNGNVYLAGSTTTSANLVIATAGAHEPAYTGTSFTSFLVKFDAAGARQWGTYYGPAGGVMASGCAATAGGDVYIGGQTSVAGGTVISTPGAHQVTYGGGSDGFLALFDGNGVRRESSYYGGKGNEQFTAIATNSLNQVFCAGSGSLSPGTAIASPGSHQPAEGGDWDGFLVQFTMCTTPAVNPVDITNKNIAICEGMTATLQVSSNGTVTWFAEPTSTDVVATGTIHTTDVLPAGTFTWFVNAKTCNFTSPFVPVVLEVGLCTALNEAEHVSPVAVYPNPGAGNFTIKTKAPAELRMYSASGALLYETQLTDESTRLNLEKFPDGIYFVQFISSSGTKVLKVAKCAGGG